jgi:ribonuclease P/MRP protein subunit RPP1
MKKYYDLCIRTPEPGVLNAAAALGWNGICVATESEGGKTVQMPSKIGSMDVYTGAIIKNDVEKNARKALERADIVIAYGGGEEQNRQASECGEIDLLMNLEFDEGKDKIDYKNAGLDHVMASNMSERGVAFGVDFSQLLSSSGRMRVQLLGRVRQNVKMALKNKVPVVLTSGASDAYGLRAPLDLASVSRLIGVPEHLERKVVSDYPAMVLEKARKRKNPNVITKGLEVTDWGDAKPNEPKKKYGWY